MSSELLVLSMGFVWIGAKRQDGRIQDINHNVTLGILRSPMP